MEQNMEQKMNQDMSEKNQRRLAGLKTSTWLKIIALVAVVVAFLCIPALREGTGNMMGAFKDLESVRTYIQSFGGWAMAISFIMMILQSVVAPIPAFVITFANAVIWGWVKGAILSWSSAMAGAALCFFLARIYGRGLAERLVSKVGLEAVEEYFERYGQYTILVARLLPFVPFDPISYAAGLTPMSFWSFFWATGLGQLPATIVYSYAAAKSSQPATFVKGLLLLFSLVALTALLKLIWTNRKKSDNKAKQGPKQPN